MRTACSVSIKYRHADRCWKKKLDFPQSLSSAYKGTVESDCGKSKQWRRFLDESGVIFAERKSNFAVNINARGAFGYRAPAKPLVLRERGAAADNVKPYFHKKSGKPKGLPRRRLRYNDFFDSLTSQIAVLIWEVLLLQELIYQYIFQSGFFRRIKASIKK